MSFLNLFLSGSQITLYFLVSWAGFKMLDTFFKTNRDLIIYFTFKFFLIIGKSNGKKS